MNNCYFKNLRNYNAPLTPVNEVYTGALQRLARDAQDRTWWNREFTGEQAVSYLESAAYNPLEDYIIKHPEFLLGPANLALNAAKTAGALALQKVAPKLLATAAVSNTWDNFLSYMKGGKQEVSRKNASSGPERISSTKQDLDLFVQQKLDRGICERWKVIDGRQTYRFRRNDGVFKKNDLITKDTRHYEAEWWTEGGKHKGAVEPINGTQYKPADSTKHLNIK